MNIEKVELNLPYGRLVIPGEDIVDGEYTSGPLEENRCRVRLTDGTVLDGIRNEYATVVYSRQPTPWEGIRKGSIYDIRSHIAGYTVRATVEHFSYTGVYAPNVEVDTDADSILAPVIPKGHIDQGDVEFRLVEGVELPEVFWLTGWRGKQLHLPPLMRVDSDGDAVVVVGNLAELFGGNFPTIHPTIFENELEGITDWQEPTPPHGKGVA